MDCAVQTPGNAFDQESPDAGISGPDQALSISMKILQLAVFQLSILYYKESTCSNRIAHSTGILDFASHTQTLQ